MKHIHRSILTVLFSTFIVAGMGLSLSCSAEDAPTATGAPAATGTQQPAAAAPAAAGGGASITGSIKLEGTPPKMKPLQFSADPVCATAHSSPVLNQEVTVDANGGLQYVIVNITEGVTEKAPTPTTSVVLDQSGCVYTPHAFALYDGQKLEIKNSDKTLHNVHCYRGTQTCFNRAMFQGMAPISHEFKESGIVKFKCDVHPWMTAYALIAPNPYYAVTGSDGSFTIADVPPGTYKVRAWHEKYGEQTQDITVTAGQPVSLDFSYQAGS